jgi:hypothetical protein
MKEMERSFSLVSQVKLFGLRIKNQLQGLMLGGKFKGSPS